jgi:predicted methyltransferase
MHAQGPLVHRFEHAEQWGSEFDHPARDTCQRPKEIIDTMAIQSGMTVADFGAGTGFDDPKLPASGVDRVLIVDTWHRVPEREAYAAKLRSGLKNGGKVFVVDFKLDAEHGAQTPYRLAPEQVARELTAGNVLRADRTDEPGRAVHRRRNARCTVHRIRARPR